MISVLHLIHHLRTGGAERMFSVLVPLLDDVSELENHVAVLNTPGELEDHIDESGIPLYRLHRRRLFNPGLVRKLNRIMRERQIDILHMHDFSAVLWGSLASMRSGVAARVITHHQVEGWHGGGLKIRKRKLCRRIIEPMIDRHIAVCKAAEKKLAEESVAAGKMAVIHNGIDVRRFGLPCDRDATRRSYGLRPDMPLVGMIGRCSKEKGGELFLAALRLLKDRGTRFQALIAGDGPERDSWQNLSRRLGIDEVTFPGHVPAERMPEVMSCLDVAVISSHAEALSIAAIELMSSGVPVVATDVGGNREVVIDGVTGFIVPPNRPEQIADRIIELIRAPERSRRMKGKAIERSRRMFSAESMARSYSRLYSEVLAEKSRLSLSLQKA